MADSLEIRLIPIGPSGYSETYKIYYEDRHKWAKDGGNWPIIKMEEIGLYKMTAGQEYYWPIDASVRTPLQGNPYMFSCDIGSETDTHLTCDAYYQLNAEVSVRVEFTKIHLKDWKSMFYKVQEFIKSIERKRP